MMNSSRSRRHRSHATSAILYRHQHARRSLVENLNDLESRLRRHERDYAHEVVLFLAGATQRREIRARKVSRLVTMFKVTTGDSDGGTDTMHTPVQQQQQQQQQQQPQGEKEEEDDEDDEDDSEGSSSGSGSSRSETEPSEVSSGSARSSSTVSPIPGGGRPAIWVSGTPKPKRTQSVDVPPEMPLDTPRRRSAPEVVITHVTLMGDDDDDGDDDAGKEDQPEEGEGEEDRSSRAPSPDSSIRSQQNRLSPTPDEGGGTQGRRSPSLMKVPSSAPSPPGSSLRTSRRPSISRVSSRPVSRISKISNTSLAFRKNRGPSPAPTTQQQESIALTEISAPLEDARFVDLLSNLNLVAVPETLTTHRLTKGPELKQDAPIILKF